MPALTGAAERDEHTIVSSGIGDTDMKVTPLEKWISEKIGDTGGRLDRGELERYQLGKLRETIALARSAGPFYRKKLSGLTEEDLREPADLGMFPFTTDEEIRRNPLQFLCVSQGEIDRVVTLRTSGDDRGTQAGLLYRGRSGTYGRLLSSRHGHPCRTRG